MWCCFAKRSFSMRIGNVPMKRRRRKDRKGGDAKPQKGANISNLRLSETKPGGRNPLQDSDLVEVEPILKRNKSILK